MKVFKVWSADRTKKVFVVIKETLNIVEQLLLEASRKMDVNGAQIVTESDGTCIEEDEVLEVLGATEPLILLESGQTYQERSNTPNSHPSTCSSSTTVTQYSGPSSPIIELIDNVEEDKFESVNLSESKTIQNYLPLIIVPATTDDKMIDPSTQDQTVVKTNNSEHSWHTFPVPWDKIPPYMLKQCEVGKVEKFIATQIVHTVVNEMMAAQKYIPYKAFRIVGKKICDKYPRAFLNQDEDGTILGDGMHGIISKMHIRYTYLCKPHKSVRESTPVPPKKRKMMNNLRAGCSNWSPEVDSQNCDNIQNFALELKLMTEENTNFFSYLDKTYAQQRCFLNKSQTPSIAEIKDEWPLLTNNKAAIFWHFEKLMNMDIKSIQLKAKAQKIVDYFTGKTKMTEKSENDDDVVVVSTSVKYIAKYFKEDIGIIIYKNILEADVGEDLKTVEPILVIVDEEGEKKISIYMEKTLLVTSHSFEEALKLLFAVYFNFNLMYPKNVSVTLEMIQRYFFKVHPDSGTKSSNTPRKKRVISFINKLVR